MSDDRPFEVFRRLLRYGTGSYSRIFVGVVGMALSSVALLVLPWLIKDTFQEAVLKQQAESLYSALGLIAVDLLVLGIARYLTSDQLEFVALRIMQQLRNELVAKLLRLPVRHGAHRRAGDILSRTFNDVRVLKDFLYNAGMVMGGDLLRVVGCVGMLFLLSWKLALITLTMGPIGGGIIAASSKWIRRRSYTIQAALSDMTSLLTEQVHALPAIQAYGAGDYEQQRFAESARTHFHEAVLGNRIHAGSREVVNFLGALAVIGVLLFGTNELLAGRDAGTVGLEPGQLVGFALYAALLLEPMTRLSRTNYEIQQSLAAGRRIFEFLDIPEEQQDGARPIVGRPRGVLQFKSVSFHYRPDEPVLSGIDLTLEPGEPVAVVGPNGAGKSTLTALILRFYDPVRGRVLLDGEDVRELRVADLRRHIGWLGQEPFLFSGTVAENIRYGAWDTSPADFDRAAHLACVDTFVRELPQGYDTRVGERGFTLSSGQRTRLALARLILRSPAMVVLDEATASLDTETECRVWKQLEGWLTERTTLIVAHRLLTVVNCPRIVVLEDGRKVGDGTAAQLQSACPTFGRIFQAQMHLAAG
jgi:subfamily B ATP-binding cassette protein MsbA